MDIVAASPPQAQIPTAPGVDPKLAAFMVERTACVVGEKLLTKNKWQLGQTVTLRGHDHPARGRSRFARYRENKRSARGKCSSWEYSARNGMGGQGSVGVYGSSRGPDRGPDTRTGRRDVQNSSARRAQSFFYERRSRRLRSMYGKRRS